MAGAEDVSELARVHQRLDDLLELVNDIKNAISVQEVMHKDCRKMVMGDNGQPGAGERLMKLEERMDSRTETARVWRVAFSVALVLLGLGLSAATYFVPLMMIGSATR